MPESESGPVPEALPRPQPPLRDWIANHDQSWLFVALYVGLAVVLSVWVSLFWLGVMVAAHLLLEVLRHRIHGMHGPEALRRALWEVKLDVALVVLALAIALYMDVIMGVLGLQSAARASAATRMGLRIAPRAVTWERTINGILLTIDDAFLVLRGAFLRRRRGGAEREGGAGEGRRAGRAGSEAPDQASDADSAVARPWSSAWGWGDRLSVGLGVLSCALILLAPLLTSHDLPSAVSLLLVNLHPLGQ